jgi:ABC-type nitrate/sulfonate/bicarbonate transport system substrate-binding protein
MKIPSLFCFAALALLYSISDTVFAASTASAKVVITPASFSEREGILVVAHHQGFFRKYNLDAQLVLMPNAPLALLALTAGDSQFYYGTTSGASLGAVLNGLDGVFVAGFINRLAIDPRGLGSGLFTRQERLDAKKEIS